MTLWAGRIYIGSRSKFSNTNEGFKGLEAVRRGKFVVQREQQMVKANLVRDTMVVAEHASRFRAIMEDEVPLCTLWALYNGLS